jgi:hypothetical protein
LKVFCGIDWADRAEHAAQSITKEYWKASALANIVEKLAATDPDRAERIAQLITDDNSRVSALANVADAVVATDRDRAVGLIADAERVARSITNNDSRRWHWSTLPKRWQLPTRTARNASSNRSPI